MFRRGAEAQERSASDLLDELIASFLERDENVMISVSIPSEVYMTLREMASSKKRGIDDLVAVAIKVLALQYEQKNITNSAQPPAAAE